MEIVLVDYENVGRSLRTCAIAEDAQVVVFLGRTGKKTTPSLHKMMGNRAEYIQIDGNGPNALDFHISFYAGMISTSNREAKITIISDDKGFDPLLAHMSKMGMTVRRMQTQH